jgi:hypothetical protein
MKTIRHNLALLLLLMLPCLAKAGEGEGGKYSKEKKIAKAYIVNPDCALQVDSQYGSIYVTTWDENKTQIEVVIKVSGNNEDKVNRRLAGISVDLNATTTLVKASTNIENNIGGNSIIMEINYTIKIPKKGSINLENQYGSIITGKIFGKATIDCQYGDVNIEELNSDNNNISLQYGGSKINYMKSGIVDVQYSSMNIVKVGNLQLEAQYTGMTFSEINNLSYNVEYGSLNVGSVGNLTGSSEYTPLRFGYVTGNFNATTGYGDIKINNMGRDAKNVAINASYSGVSVNYNENVAFDFEIRIEYGGFNGGSGLKFIEKSDRDNSARYKGYYKAQGVNRMYIKSEYGSVSLSKS